MKSTQETFKFLQNRKLPCQQPDALPTRQLAGIDFARFLLGYVDSEGSASTAVRSRGKARGIRLLRAGRFKISSADGEYGLRLTS